MRKKQGGLILKFKIGVIFTGCRRAYYAYVMAPENYHTISKWLTQYLIPKDLLNVILDGILHKKAAILQNSPLNWRTSCKKGCHLEKEPAQLADIL